jgi:hypothetical protein
MTSDTRDPEEQEQDAQDMAQAIEEQNQEAEFEAIMDEAFQEIFSVYAARKFREEMRSFSIGQYIRIEDGFAIAEEDMYVQPGLAREDDSIPLYVLDDRINLGVVVDPAIGGNYLTYMQISQGSIL